MRPSILLRGSKNNKGATIVLVAIILVVILGIAALAIDIGNLASTKGELQKLGDGAALAGAGDLGVQRLNGVSCDAVSVTDIYDTANDVAQNNEADAKSISLQSGEVVLGCWDWDSLDFKPAGDPDCDCTTYPSPNAVKVTARRDSTANTPVDTFFAGVLGQETVDLNANATAALSGTCSADGLLIPVGISKAWFDPSNWVAEGKKFCDQPIKFYPTGNLAGCAGWNTFGSWPANAAKLSSLLQCLALPESDPDYCAPPEASAGDNLVYTGGNVASAFDDMKALYDAKKDPVTGEWKVTVPVYDLDDCSNPSGNIPIIGFTTAIITGVYESPTHTIEAKVICDQIEGGHGGCGNFGTLGSIPGLVE
jgi:Flp pilus assembly protein TadG